MPMIFRLIWPTEEQPHKLGQTHPNKSLEIAEKLFDCVGPFCGAWRLKG